uniref:Uncharacterized protein n=1 Tax=Sus scrofa TaxID=9823 RepID=A0A8D1CT25_PIG
LLKIQRDYRSSGIKGTNQYSKDRSLLKANDNCWEELILKCLCNDGQKAQVQQTLLNESGCLLCARDLLRKYEVTTTNHKCSTFIHSFKCLMRSKDNESHYDIKAYKICNQRFCVVNKQFIGNNLRICQRMYEKGIMSEAYIPQVY